MRTLIRAFLNLALIVAAVATDVWLTTTRVYQHSSRDARSVMLGAVVLAAFLAACMVLAKVKPKPQGRSGLPYATIGRRK